MRRRQIEGPREHPALTRPARRLTTAQGITAGLVAGAVCAGALVLAAVLVVTALLNGLGAAVGSIVSGTDVPYPPFSLVATGINDIETARITSVSCTSATSCVAVGTGTDAASGTFFVEERHGRWSSTVPIAVATPPAAEQGASSSAEVSCWSAGECTVVGDVELRSRAGGVDRAFSLTERDGVWGTATVILPTVAQPTFSAISCWAPGECVTGWGSPSSLAYVASEHDGTWGPPIPLASPADVATRRGGDGLVILGCTRVGYCLTAADAGEPARRSAPVRTYVAELSDATWSSVRPVTSPALERESVEPTAVSCAGAAFCELVASASPLVTSQWPLRGTLVLSLAALDGRLEALQIDPGGAGVDRTTGGGAWVLGLACWQPGDCVAVGQALAPRGATLGYAIVERGLRWQRVAYLGVRARLRGGQVDEVSCTSVGFCTGLGESAQGIQLGVDGHDGLDLADPHRDHQPVTYEAAALSCGGATTCVDGGQLLFSDDSYGTNAQAALTELVGGVLGRIRR